MINPQDLPLYFKYTKNPYKPTEVEKDFHDEIVYYAFNVDSSDALFAESFLMFDCDDDNNATTYLFTSLIEALDKTQITAKKRLLRDTLDIVLTYYKNDLSSVIDYYLSSDIIKQNTKNYLKGVIRP